MTKEEFWYKLSWLFNFDNKLIYSIYKTVKNKNLNVEDIIKLEQINGVSYQKLIEEGIQVIFYDHEKYPSQLLELIKDHPPILFCKGNIDLLNSPSVAIVGSRNASTKGLELAREIAQKLAKKGINVISGYAKGIDTQAHIGALESNGTTTIVLSMGILNFSESKISEFFNKDKILIVSQFNPQVPWSAQNAMTRNELVCALSKAVIVIESGPEKEEKNGKIHYSGTYDAAKKAIKMEIPLFVIDPSLFETPPVGNITLLKKEKAIKIQTDDACIDEIVKQVRPIQEEKITTPKEEIQPNFLDQPESK
jgi:DNA processing protein